MYQETYPGSGQWIKVVKERPKRKTQQQAAIEINETAKANYEKCKQQGCFVGETCSLIHCKTKYMHVLRSGRWPEGCPYAEKTKCELLGCPEYMEYHDDRWCHKLKGINESSTRLLFMYALAVGYCPLGLFGNMRRRDFEARVAGYLPEPGDICND